MIHYFNSSTETLTRVFIHREHKANGDATARGHNKESGGKQHLLLVLVMDNGPQTYEISTENKSRLYGGWWLTMSNLYVGKIEVK